MRKYDEGYALPFAVVVMLVLGIIVASILPFSLQNFKNQQASIERMQHKYEAQGKIEALIAQYEVEIARIANPHYGNLVDAKNEVASIFSNTDKWIENSGKYSYKVEFVVKGGTNDTVQIACTVVLNDVIVFQDNVYKIQKPTISYESYTITYVEATVPAETTEDTP